MDLGLKGKVAMVGGASRGLGFAVAEALASEGAHVSIASSNAGRHPRRRRTSRAHRRPDARHARRRAQEGSDRRVGATDD